MSQITHFYFLRHGQTQAHIDKLICGGGWDIELTEDGLFSAQKAANLHKYELADVQRIVSSPMKRTEQTARFFSEILNLKVEYDLTIAEWSLGEWDRLPYSEVQDLFEGQNNPPGGEPRQVFRDRVEMALENILRSGKIPLIVSHGAVWDAVARTLSLTDTHIPSCVPVKVSFGDACNKLIFPA